MSEQAKPQLLQLDVRKDHYVRQPALQEVLRAGNDLRRLLHDDISE